MKKKRLAIFRSNKFIYAQVIDDEKSVTLASARGDDPEKVGQEVAKKALTKKVKIVVFDKRKYRYHGKVKILAEAARKEGLKF